MYLSEGTLQCSGGYFILHRCPFRKKCRTKVKKVMVRYGFKMSYSITNAQFSSGWNNPIYKS